MLAEERFAIILKQLDEKHSVTVQELCELLATSESTVRRDLLMLHEQGRLNKVHGGATQREAEFHADEQSMTAKEEQAIAEKQSIAAYAATLIRAEDFVFIDAGSTTLQMVRCLSGEALEASYVTSGIAHARALAQKGCRVYVPGGQIRPNTEAIVGAAAVTGLRRYNFTKAFLGVNGVSVTAGFTTPDTEEAEVKSTVVNRALESWFLADDSKFGKVYAAVICELMGASIITNRLPNEKYRKNVLIKETESI